MAIRVPASGTSAAAVSFAPTGQIAATNVQSALAEVDSEKAPLANPLFTSASESATLGANLVSNGDFAAADLSAWGSPANWALLSGAAKHTAGSTAALAQALAGIVNGSLYEVSFAISGRTAGSVTFSLGSAVSDVQTASGSVTLVAAASGSVTFSVTPTSDFDGSVDNITAQVVVPAAPSARFGTSAQHALYTPGASNLGVGVSALRSNTTGVNNTGVGVSALRSNTTGGSNTGVGVNALQSNTTGGSNTGVGVNALLSNTTGGSNTGVGASALYAPSGNAANATTTGSRQTAIGVESGQASATQRNDIIAVGYRALVDGDNTVAVGSGAQALHAGAVALGQGSATTAVDQVMVGTRDVEIAGNATKGVVMRSPDGTRYRLTVANGGTLTITAI